MVNLLKRTLVRTLLWHCGLLAPQTQTSETERAAIARHAAGRRRLVEIGVFNGVTTLVIRQAMAPDAVLWGIDPFPPGRLGYNLDERIARRTVGRSDNGTVEFVKTTGSDAARLYRDRGLPPVEFLFIDGDHSWAGIDGDWKGWAPLIGPGGVVGLHDSRTYPGRDVRHDSVRYTREVILPDPRFEAIEEVDSLTLLRAKG